MQPIETRLSVVFDLIRARAPVNCIGRGCSDEELGKCEQQLGVRLPGSYRRLLQQFAFVWWPDYIYGLDPGPLPGLKVTWQTEQWRRERHPRLPDHLIPFHPDGWGNEYCLDTARLVDGECPVVFWDCELDADQKPEETHTSFLDWLEAEIAREIDQDSDGSAGRGAD